MIRSNLETKLCAVALCVGSVAYAGPAALLPLNPGTYVLASYEPCEEAPLAGVVEFDGKAIFGPHESRCTASVVSHRGSTYRVSTECAAHGDGTPQTPSRWVRTVHVESESRLAVIAQGKPVEYQLCPAFH
jgi:hypothetical protein